MIQEMPEAGQENVRHGPFFGQIERMHGTLVEILPPTEAVNLEGIYSIASATTSFTSTGLFGISGTVYVGMPRRWLAGKINEFAGIQERHKTIAKVRDLLILLQARNSHSPDVVAEYDVMIDKAFYFKGNEIDKTTSAGISMRNVLEHVKGKLFALAKGSKGQKPSWVIMTEELCADTILSYERQLLVEQETTWDELHSALSDMAKNRTETDTKIMAVQVITHLFTVLTLLKM